MLNHTRSYKIWTLTGRLVHQYKCESMGDELWEAMWQGAPHGTFAPPKVGAIATVQQDSKQMKVSRQTKNVVFAS